MTEHVVGKKVDADRELDLTKDVEAMGEKEIVVLVNAYAKEDTGYRRRWWQHGYRAAVCRIVAVELDFCGG